jgi:hypothetical protein
MNPSIWWDIKKKYKKQITENKKVCLGDWFEVECILQNLQSKEKISFYVKLKLYFYINTKISI